METMNPYILMIQEQFYEIYNPLYFDIILFPLCIIIPFFAGRLLHEKKLTNLLHIIDNQETARKQISEDLQNIHTKIVTIKSKKWHAIGLSSIIAAAIIIQVYAFTPHLTVNLSLIFFVALIWIIALLRVKYLIWLKVRYENKLKTTKISSEEEVKQILKQVGENITKQMKLKFQANIDLRRIKQQREQCKMMRCYNEKKALRQLIDLYKDIIKEIKTVNWCDICASRQNINSYEIKLNQYEKNLKAFATASLDQTIILDRKKQINNVIQNEEQKLWKMLPYICKKGCCIRFREEIDKIKKHYFSKIKLISGTLHSL